MPVKYLKYLVFLWVWHARFRNVRRSFS